MSRIVCKFGGSSLADVGQFKKVKSIVESDAKRTLVVPSAPGKRTKADVKLTDLLLASHASAKVGADFSGPFAGVRERFLQIEGELGLDAQMSAHLDKLEQDLKSGASSDYAGSRGEYLNGRLLAGYLGADFVDPAEFITIQSNGSVDAASYNLLGERLKDSSRRYVVPGFYGKNSRGDVQTFSRGGSDITGAIVARAVLAERYENWTDVSGLLMADPRVVDSPRSMQEVTYREIRELSYMGATVIHDEAIAPVREVGIPINIRNTNDPAHAGTRIVKELSEAIDKSTEIAGIAGTTQFAMVSLSKNLMNKQIGFGYRLLGILERHGISYEHCPSSIDGISVVLHRSQIEDRAEQILEEIRTVLEPDTLEYSPAIALVAVVGEGMSRSIGISAKLFIALRDANINIRLINQGASELNIIFGVVPDDYERAVKAVYDAFVA